MSKPTQITVSQEIGVTVGQNYNFDKTRLFTSVTAEVEEGETIEAAYADLSETVRNLLQANANRLTDTPSTAAAVSEARSEANADTVPQVTATRHAPNTANWNGNQTDGMSGTTTTDGTITCADLTAGDFPKKTTLQATVRAVYDNRERGTGPSFKSILTSGGSEIGVAHWGDATPEWNQGDTVHIQNAFKVKDGFKGGFDLDLGKFCKIEVVGSAAPETLETWG